MTESRMEDEWVYDEQAWRMTTKLLCDRNRRITIAKDVSPENAAIILSLIGIARGVVLFDNVHGPLSDSPDCKCFVCESRRVLKAIGGGE